MVQEAEPGGLDLLLGGGGFIGGEDGQESLGGDGQAGVAGESVAEGGGGAEGFGRVGAQSPAVIEPDGAGAGGGGRGDGFFEIVPVGGVGNRAAEEAGQDEVGGVAALAKVGDGGFGAGGASSDLAEFEREIIESAVGKVEADADEIVEGVEAVVDVFELAAGFEVAVAEAVG